MDIFTTTTEAIRLTKAFIDEVKTGVKAEETVQNLVCVPVPSSVAPSIDYNSASLTMTNC